MEFKKFKFETNIKYNLYYYHFTALDNLESIIDEGLCSRSTLLNKDINFNDIADPSILFGREKEKLEYSVPFHFTIDTSFSYFVKNVYHRKDFIFLCVSKVFAKKNHFKIIPFHPLSNEIKEKIANEEKYIFDYDEGIKNIDFNVFNNFNEENKQKIMAEVLSIELVSFKNIKLILVKNVEIAKKVRKILDEKGYPNISIKILDYLEPKPYIPEFKLSLNDIEKDQYLYHITNINNLEGIIKYGLQSREYLKLKNISCENIRDDLKKIWDYISDQDIFKSHVSFYFTIYNKFIWKFRKKYEDFVILCVSRNFARKNSKTVCKQGYNYSFNVFNYDNYDKCIKETLELHRVVENINQVDKTITLLSSILFNNISIDDVKFIITNPNNIDKVDEILKKNNCNNIYISYLNNDNNYHSACDEF